MPEAKIVYFTPLEQSQERMRQCRNMADAVGSEIRLLDRSQSEDEYRKRVYHLSELCDSISRIARAEYHAFDKPFIGKDGEIALYSDNDNDEPLLPDEY